MSVAAEQKVTGHVCLSLHDLVRSCQDKMIEVSGKTCLGGQIRDGVARMSVDTMSPLEVGASKKGQPFTSLFCKLADRESSSTPPKNKAANGLPGLLRTDSHAGRGSLAGMSNRCAFNSMQLNIDGFRACEIFPTLATSAKIKIGKRFITLCRR